MKMFYEEDKILRCPHCKNRFKEPKVLPCGTELCSVCLSSIVDSNSSARDSFNCVYCDDKHTIPAKGFPLSKSLEKMLSIRLEETPTSKMVKELKASLENMKSLIDKTNHDLAAGAQRISEKFSHLKIEVQLRSESLILEINKLNENLQNEIEQYEKECLKSFEIAKSKYKKKDEIKSNLILKQEFYESSLDYLDQTKIEYGEVYRRASLVQQYMRDIDLIRKIINKELFLRKVFKFVEGPQLLDPSLIGMIESPFEETLLANSAILNDQQKLDLYRLCNFSSEQNWQLLYRASRDGRTAQAFHSRCDDQSNTLTVISTLSGCIFGGYTDRAWDSSGAYKTDPNAYLFSLVNPTNCPKIFMANAKTGGKYAIFCYLLYGPTFGKAFVLMGDPRYHDLHISYTTDSSSNLGNSFLAKDIDDNNINTKCYFTGSSDFSFAEIEVFKKDSK